MTLVLFILLGLLGLILFSGGYMFLVACGRRKDPDWLDEAVASKTPNAPYYEFMVASERWLKEHRAQSVYTTGKDGIRLHALWVPAENSQGTVLLAHGYRSTMLLDFHLAFSLFHTLGFNILVPEQRTHGHSGGNYITFGVKESGDMARWIDYHNHHLCQNPVVLFGISMGASTMLYLADRCLPENVKGIIADCGFTSPAAILSCVYKKLIHLPPAPTVWAADLFARVFAGFSFYEKDTRKILASSRLPVLMIHGEADSFVPCEMTRQGYAACAGKKTLLTVPEAEHGMSFLAGGYQYTAAVLDFLKDNIPAFHIPPDYKQNT